MIERIVAQITYELLKGEEPDREALELVIGSYILVDGIIEGIKHGIRLYAGQLDIGDYTGE